MGRALSLGLLLLIACSHATNSVAAIPIRTVTIHGSDGPIHVAVEEADSPAERERGLMGRGSLAPDAGMVFVFTDVSDGPVTARFWMKDTEIPLSIAFWDADGRIVAIRDMDPCHADPCPQYGSPTPYVAALEVDQGFFQEHGIDVGDRVTTSS